MDAITLLILVVAVMLLIMILAIRSAYDIGYDAGWEEGVKDVLSVLPEECVKTLAEEPTTHPIIDCNWK